ncbi:MAG: 7-cyano-7-deazaguanine synthase QueC [Opitutia bacterium AMD-G3]|jgi:7-cyano-7-deazaguanine synthase|nr:MAG: 7-cyano-7-deazaguanine synthase QueC [Opitutae bacterium AMD-G3]
MKRTVLIHSGGIDSTVLLGHLLAEGREVYALSVDYGQRHRRELEAAKRICAHYGVKHQVADLRALAPLFGANALTDSHVAVPEGHYEEASMKATVVPNRNMLLIAVAASWAMSLKASSVAYGAHGGDHAIYPDCRPVFADALDKAIRLADWHEVCLERPFVGMDKTGIVRRGVELRVPLELTWSCYVGGDKHCGKCGTCVERKEAFVQAGVKDPTAYLA